MGAAREVQDCQQEQICHSTMSWMQAWTKPHVQPHADHSRISGQESTGVRAEHVQQVIIEADSGLHAGATVMLRMENVGVAALLGLHLLFSHKSTVRVGHHPCTIDASCHAQHQG